MKINKRSNKLVLRSIKRGIDPVKARSAIYEWARILQIPKKQIDMIDKAGGRIHRVTEQSLEKRREKSMLASLEGFMLNLATLFEKHDIGLRTLTDRDFKYNYYYQQLENLRPLPSTELNDKVAQYLSYTYSLNSLLMMQQAFFKDIERTLSEEKLLTNLQYPQLVKEKMDHLLAGISEYITGYQELSNKKQ